MQYITFTELRTRAKELEKALKDGHSVELIHRSQVLGEINPVYNAKPLTKEGIKRIQEAAKKLNFPKLSYKKRERVYRNHLIEKYGKVQILSTLT